MRSFRPIWCGGLSAGFFAACCAAQLIVSGQDLPRDEPRVDDMVAQRTKLQSQIDLQHARHQALVTEQEVVDHQRTEVRAQLGQRVRWLYRMSQAGILPLGEGIDAMLTHLANLHRLERMIARGASTLESLETQDRALEEERQALDLTLAGAQAKLKALDETKRQLAKVAERFDHTMKTAKAAPARDDRNFEAGSQIRAKGISGLRGRLPFPVISEFQAREASRPEGDGPGMEFLCAAGSAVRAVGHGRVAFSDRYGGYGRLVIVDHDDGYYTVYAGLGEVDVRVGDELGEGARIGTVGSTPTPAALFFEIRQGNQTLRPGPWFGL